MKDADCGGEDAEERGDKNKHLVAWGSSPGRNTVKNKWVFRIKAIYDGMIARIKGRLDRS